MMTSTFPNCRSNLSLKNGLKEIQSKKQALLELEIALKKRIDELRELCLKEGELIGQLPVDYPLQPREPIPQIRRRVKSNSNSNLNEINGIAPPCPVKMRYNRQDSMMHPYAQSSSATPLMNLNIPLPSRPTSSNSTSSSGSTASSNTRSTGMASSIQSTHSAPPCSSNHTPFNIINNGTNNNGHGFIPYTISTMKPQQHFNFDGMVKFQPYYEETKPFQMSDFYKYSSKHNVHRQRSDAPEPPKCKTTRQLQDDVSRTNSLRFNSCDDQIQASVKLIEKSGQKLIEATAKAIASNPGLAEKLNSILPRNGERY